LAPPLASLGKGRLPPPASPFRLVGHCFVPAAPDPIMAALSRAVPMVFGAAAANLLSGGLWLMTGAPASRAAWSWQCTAYTDGASESPIYMNPGADGPTCSDGSKLNCSCAVDPCVGAEAALPSNLACAGAGSDSSTDGCFKLHHTYGTSPGALAAVAGRGSGQLTNACGAASIIKVYGNAAGLDMLLTWTVVAAGQNDSSVVPTSAKKCQELCAADVACKFFTYNDQGASGGNYGYFRGLCFLQEELTCGGEAFSMFHGAISGPASCPTPSPTPAPAGADASAAVRGTTSLRGVLGALAVSVASGGYSVLAASAV